MGLHQTLATHRRLSYSREGNTKSIFQGFCCRLPQLTHIQSYCEAYLSSCTTHNPHKHHPLPPAHNRGRTSAYGGNLFCLPHCHSPLHACPLYPKLDNTECTFLHIVHCFKSPSELERNVLFFVIFLLGTLPMPFCFLSLMMCVSRFF